VTTNGGENWSALNAGYPTTGLTLNSIDLPYRVPAPLESPDGPADEINPPTLNAASPVPGLSAAVSPSPTGGVLVGTAGKGVVHWNGSSWLQTTVAAGKVNAVLIDSRTPAMTWMGGDPSAGTLQVSTDSGQTWISAATGLGGRTVFSLAQGTFDPNQFLAGTDAGVYLSADGGTTWTRMGLATEAVKAVAFDPSMEGSMLAGTAAALYRSINFGLSWHNLASQPEGYGFLGVSICPTAPGSFYFYSRYGGVVRIFD
jgi:photosystem II stability/assembly factor-like uncharacterized protein